MAGFVFAPTTKIVTPSEPGNIAGGTALTGPYVPFDHFRHVTVVVGTDATASTTFTITFQQAKDTSGTGAKVLGFTDIVSTALDGEGYTELAVTANSYATVATTTGGLWIVEFMASNLDAHNDFDHIQLNLAGVEATNGMLTMMIFDQAGYKGHTESLKPVSTFTATAIA